MSKVTQVGGPLLEPTGPLSPSEDLLVTVREAVMPVPLIYKRGGGSVIEKLTDLLQVLEN